MPTVTLDKKVPDFAAAATGGNPFRLKDALKAGQAVVVYFYPKDLTSGCTKESCAFGALHKQFSKAGVVTSLIRSAPASTQARATVAL